MSENFTGMVDPDLKAALPSTEIGAARPDHATWTVTVNDLCAVLPDASVAVHVTVVVPSGTTAPEATLHATRGSGSARSVAETA